MNGSMYREILEKNLQKSATSFRHGRNFVLQHDNDPKHTAKYTKEWFENNGISTLNWPSQTPESNPNENLWNILKVKVHPQNIKQLKILGKEKWGKINAGSVWKTSDQLQKAAGSSETKTDATQQNINTFA